MIILLEVASPSFLENVYTLGGQLSNISAWLTIASFALTIVVMFNTRNIKEKVQATSKFKSFKQDKTALINDLQSTKDLIMDNPNDIRNIHDLSETLRRLGEYKEFMEKGDKNAFKFLLSVTRMESIHGKGNKIISNLGILIGFLKKRIDMEIENL